MNLHDWNICSRSLTCVVTGQPFIEEQAVQSVLYRREAGYERCDYSEAGWAQVEDKTGVLSVWKSTFKLPPPPAPEAFQKDDAESLLRVLIERNEPGQVHARYILALMLERKRVLKEITRQEIDGQSVLIYEHLASGETWVVPHPQLKLDAMEQVQQEVSGLLMRGLGVAS